MIRTPTDDAAWVVRCQAVTERLKAKEATIKAGASAQEGTGARDAAQQPERVEAALGATGLDRSGGDGQEPGLTTRTPETVEVSKAATSTCDARQADVEETKDVVETPQDAGKEEKLPGLQTEWEEPQQQPQHQQRQERPS
jgi:hypothetical protein